LLGSFRKLVDAPLTTDDLPDDQFHTLKGKEGKGLG
jgi:hypothetical protein